MSYTGTYPKRISESGEFPMFSYDNQRVFFQTGGSFFGNLTKKLKSVNLDGKDEKSHFTSKLANRIVPSPDNKWVAIIHLHKVYVAPFVHNGKEINILQRLPKILEKGIPLASLMNSQVFLFEFDFDEWPMTHYNRSTVFRAYNESVFAIRQHYLSTFPESSFARMVDIDDPLYHLDSSKIYKIDYSINLLPSTCPFIEQEDFLSPKIPRNSD